MTSLKKLVDVSTNATNQNGCLAEKHTNNCDPCGEGAVAVDHTVLLRIWWLGTFEYSSILVSSLQIHYWKQKNKIMISLYTHEHYNSYNGQIA